MDDYNPKPGDPSPNILDFFVKVTDKNGQSFFDMSEGLRRHKLWQSVQPVITEVPNDCKVDDGEVCEECCEHGDMDEGQCLDCGADRMEDMMAAAYDRAKDARKYGDD